MTGFGYFVIMIDYSLFCVSRWWCIFIAVVLSPLLLCFSFAWSPLLSVLCHCCSLSSVNVSCSERVMYAWCLSLDSVCVCYALLACVCFLHLILSSLLILSSSCALHTSPLSLSSIICSHRYGIIVGHICVCSYLHIPTLSINTGSSIELMSCVVSDVFLISNDYAGDGNTLILSLESLTSTPDYSHYCANQLVSWSLLIAYILPFVILSIDIDSVLYLDNITPITGLLLSLSSIRKVDRDLFVCLFLLSSLLTASPTSIRKVDLDLGLFVCSCPSLVYCCLPLP